MKHRSNQSSLAARFALFLVFALVFSGLGLFVGSGLAEENTGAEEKVGYEAVLSGSNVVPGIASEVNPSVVSVFNMGKSWNPNTGEITAADQSAGSGVVIDEKGYIVTNYHVIADYEIVQVRLPGQEDRLDAEVVGYDPSTDIAVLKIESEGLKAVPMGDSDALTVGELVVAIGNPGIFDQSYPNTVTAGIISALERDMSSGSFSRGVNTIQTDAAINPGNSGGALLNAKGELIGIPTLKISGNMFTTNYEGLGFAIPINTVKPIAEQLIRDGKITRPRMGVTVSDHRGPEEAIRTSPPAGVEIINVEEGGPAERAGIELGDIITHVDGSRVTSVNQLTREIDKHTAGDTITVTVYRNTEDSSVPIRERYMDMDVVLELIDIPAARS